MNTHELIECTMLHALGLLEDDERQAYEAAFDAAPKPVQIRVREEARRMADLGDLIPGVEPSSELRPMVVAAVRAAIREDENESRIAQQASEASPVVGRIDASTPAPVRVTSQPKLSKSTRVNHLWRVAGIGFAAASIAMGVVIINIQQTLQEANRNGFVNSFYDEIGARYLDDTFFNENTKRVILASTDASNTSRASIFHNPDWNKALFVVKNLPSEQDKPLRLVILDENDNIVEVITTFTPTGEREEFEIEVNMSTANKLAIYPDQEQEIMDQIEPMYVSIDSSL